MNDPIVLIPAPVVRSEVSITDEAIVGVLVFWPWLGRGFIVEFGKN